MRSANLNHMLLGHSELDTHRLPARKSPSSTPLQALMRTLFLTLLILGVNVIAQPLTVCAEPTKDASINPVDETPQFETPQAKEINVCELYESLAVIKAKAETQIDSSCACELTTETCGKNWRGAQKKVFKCRCALPGACRVNTCSISDITATAKATKLCKKTTCSCVPQGETSCAKSFLGKRSTPFACHCPQK